MYKFLQRNNKKLLAVFTAFLMVVFIITLSPTIGNMGQQHDPIVAHIGETKVYATELRAAKEDWDLLKRLSIKGVPFHVPFFLTLASPEQMMMAVQMQRMPPTIQELNDHPELFLLLQREAEQMGVQVGRDRLEEVLRNQVEVPKGIPVDEQHLRRAVQGLLLVKGGFERAASVVKISEPMRKQGVAEHFQTLKLDVVEVPAKDFETDLPEASSAQLQEQFKKFAELAPGMHDPESNPMGFGYLFPNRVKVQYLAIPRDEVRKAIQDSKSDYEWKVQAYEYYAQNKSQFPTTQPAATQPAASTTRPTTRPFEEVREDIMTRLVRTESDKLTATIRDKIAAQMASDYVAFQAAATASGTTQPTTAPSTSLGVPYSSFQYLEKLAAKIQKEHGVLPAVTNVAEYKTQEELGDLSGIGNASLGMGTGGTFGDYAIGAAEAFVPAEFKNTPRVLSLFEPSAPLSAYLDETVYIFRITDAQKTHKPTDATEVLAKLKEDFATAAAFEKAKAAADEIIKLAKESSLESAAKSGGRTVNTVGPWRGGNAEIPGLVLSPSARPVFAREMIRLLKDAAASDDHHPLAVIALPQDKKVLVVRLADVQAVWDPTMAHMVDLQIDQQMLDTLQSLMQLGWFDRDSVIARMNYREERSSEQPTPTESTPASSAPPIM